MKYFKVFILTLLVLSAQAPVLGFGEDSEEGNLVEAKLDYFAWGGGEVFSNFYGKVTHVSNADLGGAMIYKAKVTAVAMRAAEVMKTLIESYAYNFNEAQGIINAGFVSAVINTKSSSSRLELVKSFNRLKEHEDFSSGVFVIERMDKTGENIFVRMTIKSELFKSITVTKTDTVEVHATLKLESCDGEPVQEIVNGDDEVHKIYDTFSDFNFARFYNCQFSVISMRNSNAYDFQLISSAVVDVHDNDMTVNILGNGKVIVRSRSKSTDILRPDSVVIEDNGEDPSISMVDGFERAKVTLKYGLVKEKINREATLVFQISNPEVQSNDASHELASKVDSVVLLLQDYASIIAMSSGDVSEAELAQAVSHFFDQNGKSIIDSVRVINELYPSLSHLDQITAQRTLRTAYEFVRAIERKVKAVRRFNLNQVFRERSIQNTGLPDSVSDSVGEELVTPLAPGATR